MRWLPSPVGSKASDVDSRSDSTSFRDRVLLLVQAIPEGRVATYGQIAALAGSPRAARIIGGILRRAVDDVPWQRVVNVRGGISTYRIGAGDLQVALLQSEGVSVEDGFVDLDEHLWRPAITSDGIVGSEEDVLG